MRVHRREIGDPIAVIGGRFLPLRPLHGLVLEDRPDPHRRRAEPGGLGQFVGQPLQVAAMIETAVGRSEAATAELQSIMRITYAVFCLQEINKYNIKSTSSKY